MFVCAHVYAHAFVCVCACICLCVHVCNDPIEKKNDDSEEEGGMREQRPLGEERWRGMEDAQNILEAGNKFVLFVSRQLN